MHSGPAPGSLWKLAMLPPARRVGRHADHLDQPRILPRAVVRYRRSRRLRPKGDPGHPPDGSLSKTHWGPAHLAQAHGFRRGRVGYQLDCGSRGSVRYAGCHQRLPPQANLPAEYSAMRSWERVRVQRQRRAWVLPVAEVADDQIRRGDSPARPADHPGRVRVRPFPQHVHRFHRREPLRVAIHRESCGRPRRGRGLREHRDWLHLQAERPVVLVHRDPLVVRYHPKPPAARLCRRGAWRALGTRARAAA